MTFPTQIDFGYLDKCFKNEEGPPQFGTVLVLRTQDLNQNKVAQIVDAGSTLFNPNGSDPFKFYHCRLMLKADLAKDCNLESGSIVKIGQVNLKELKTGERLLEPNYAEVVGKFDNLGPITKSTKKHPLCEKHGNDIEGPWYNEDMVRKMVTTCFDDVRESDLENMSFDDNGYNAEKAKSTKTIHRTEPYGNKPVVRRPDVNFCKITDLGPYVSKWTIKARVCSKQEVRQFNTARAGKVFSVDLVDSSKGEIRASFWNEAVDAFYNVLQVGGVYSFSRGQIRPANKRWNTLNNAYELSFGNDAEIVALPNDTEAAEVPTIVYDFQSIKSLETRNRFEIVDILAVATRISPMTQITLKSTGGSKERRVVTLLDKSETSVDLTCWGLQICSLFDIVGWGTRNPKKFLCIAIKKARVEEFQNNKQLGVLPDSKVSVFPYDAEKGTWNEDVNEDELNLVPGIKDLVNWYSKTGIGIVPQRSRASMDGSRDDGKRTTIGEISLAVRDPSNSVDLNEKGLWFTCVATISSQVQLTGNRKFFWTSCSSCRKKVQPMESQDEISSTKNEAFCQTCGQNTILERKYILPVDIEDETGTLKLTAFGEVGQTILGISADELEHLRNTGGEDAIGREWKDFQTMTRQRPFVFRMVAKNEVWQDEQRIRYRAISCVPLEEVMVEESRLLRRKIESMGAPSGFDAKQWIASII